jgi:hypothetical protein
MHNLDLSSLFKTNVFENIRFSELTVITFVLMELQKQSNIQVILD